MTRTLYSYISGFLILLAVMVITGACSDEDGSYDDLTASYAVFRMTGQVVFDEKTVTNATVEVLRVDDDGKALYVELFSDEEEEAARIDVTDSGGNFSVEVRTLANSGYNFRLKVTSDVVEEPEVFLAGIENYTLDQDPDYLYANDGRYIGTVSLEMPPLVLGRSSGNNEPEPSEPEEESGEE